MKKIINVKEIMIILISVLLITLSTTVFATDLVLGNNNNATTITGNEYDNAQTVPTDNNTTNTTNNTVNNLVNNSTNNKNNNNTTKKYNTNNTNTNLPQTGIEDYNVGILLVVCIASAIYAYKKITDYKNI